MCSSGKPKVGTKNFNLSCCITIASNSNVNKILKSIAVIIVSIFLAFSFDNNISIMPPIYQMLFHNDILQRCNNTFL